MTREQARKHAEDIVRALLKWRTSSTRGEQPLLDALTDALTEASSMTSPNDIWTRVERITPPQDDEEFNKSTIVQPCPFCGSDNVRVLDDGTINMRVTCRDCASCGSKAHTREDAIEKWNKVKR